MKQQQNTWLRRHKALERANVQGCCWYSNTNDFAVLGIVLDLLNEDWEFMTKPDVRAMSMTG